MAIVYTVNGKNGQIFDLTKKKEQCSAIFHIPINGQKKDWYRLLMNSKKINDCGCSYHAKLICRYILIINIEMTFHLSKKKKFQAK